MIAEGRWSWLLYVDGTRHVLCVVCGSVALYELAFELRPDEVDAVRAGGVEAVDRLARQVSDAPRASWERRLAGFNDEPGVREATERWRAAAEAPDTGRPWAHRPYTRQRSQPLPWCRPLIRPLMRPLIRPGRRGSRWP